MASPKRYLSEAVDAATEELLAREDGTSEYKDPEVIREERKRLHQTNSQTSRAKSKPNFRYLASFFRLIKSPDTHRIRTTTKNRFLLTLRFYFISMLLLFIAAIPAIILEQLGVYTIPKQFDVIPAFFNDPSDRTLGLILISVIAGVLEETQFRLVLHKFNKRYFDIFVSLFAGYLVTKVFGKYFLVYTDSYSNFLIQSALIYLILAAPIYLTLSRTKTHSKWFEQNWKTAYKGLFYGLAFLFAFVHLPTMDLMPEHFIFLPLTILTFFVYALIFSYVRIRIGFQYAVLLHFTIDLIVLTSKY